MPEAIEKINEGDRKVLMSFRLTSRLRDGLKAFAKSQKKSASEIIRTAVENQIKTWKAWSNEKD